MAKRLNTVKDKWGKGEVTYGGWLCIPSTISAEVIAKQAFDWVCVDMQHGLIDYSLAVAMITAINTTGNVPFVRVPWNEPGIIGKVLDAGALGVIIPMVNSVQEATQAVSYCRYFPSGSRSYGPVRAGLVYGSDYFSHANEEIACIPMIETARAVECIDDILSVPGIDAIFVGPADLSITLGLPPRKYHNEEVFENALIKIVKACKRKKVIAGIHGDATLAEKHASTGYQMIAAAVTDTAGLAKAASEDLNFIRGKKSEPENSQNTASKPVYG